MARKFPQGQKCIYCDERLAENRDHVVARQLLPVELPPGTNLPTAPSCGECNASFQESEESLRMMLALNWLAVRQSPQLKSLHDGPVGRMIQRDPRLRSILREKLRYARLDMQRSKGKVYAPVLEWKGTDVSVALRKIIRGLYWLEHQRTLPKEYAVVMRYADDDMLGYAIEFFKQYGIPLREIVRDVFEYCTGNAHDDPFQSMWMLCFFETLYVSAFTVPQDEANE